MSKHTKGPWVNRWGLVYGRSIGGVAMQESEFMVAQIRGWGHLQYLGDSEAAAIQEANALLIAAAPDLLKACKLTYEAATVCLNTYAASEAMQKKVVAELAFAIAKAEEVK